MKHSNSKNTIKLSTRMLVILALLTTILFISQLALAGLPNIEVVSLLVIIYTLLFRKKVFYIIYGFALLEGLFYGFGVWWIMYLYVWSILALITMMFSHNRSVIFWSIVSGGYALLFGFLCAIPYYIMGGVGAGFSYWISGIPFDITHCISNVALTAILFKPIYATLSRLSMEVIHRTSFIG